MASGHVNCTQRPNTCCTDQACDVKILLANSEPSTHGPMRHLVRCSDMSGVEVKADSTSTATRNKTRAQFVAGADYQSDYCWM